VNKPFPSARTVLGILTEVMNANVNQPLYQPQQLHDYLKGLTIVYNQPGTSFSNVFKYNGLKDSARNQTFMLEKRKMTVESYFKEKNITLRYPHLPCLWCGPTIKNIYLPLEFCSIQHGQVIKKKLSENQIRTVIAETATSTDLRKRRIMDLLNKIRHNESKVVQQFGINIGDKFTEVEARILPAPGLEYLTNPEVKVDRGVWNAEREKFLDGKNCTHWSVLKLDDRCPNSDIMKLSSLICEIGGKANMSFAPRFTDLIEMRSNSRKQEIEEKMLALKRKNVELLFVIIPNRSEAYPNVKQAAELKCGILTQCIKSFTLARKLNGSTVYNILLKLNSKLNGLNHKVVVKHTPPIGRGKIMIVGADVTHPTGTMNEPSAVGVAASHDINALKYNMCWRIQNPTQEMITDLKNIMIEQLNYYKKCMNNDLPDKILYYRDGVSDGQFEDVLNIELAAIYNACQQMAPTYKPAVTFIVVQKRHNTRFYPGTSKISCGKNNNVMPGTIVDKFIIDPRQYQFFLVSHAAIQGVAKPTKYCVIWDDSNIKADELHALTHNLCHVFTRCNRAVSYVAPTYYAHLAAYRGKVYIQNERLNMDNLDQEFRQRQIREEISKGHPMFFV
jgi:eukaryotic translation initiation factor 2C